MALNLRMPDQQDLRPRITVFGVGGAGGNAVNNMIAKQLEGADFVVANTDAQALQQSKSPIKMQLGTRITEGLGAGARPDIGAAAAEENIEQIVDVLAGSHMCFITAGMGGGTGTGAAPVIAQAARELGVLTVGVVTKPFQFEGAKRMRQAEEGVEALKDVVDTLIIIPNQNLFRLANENTTFTEAFALADDVLYQGVKGVTDLMVRPGIINLDFADVRSVMNEMGKAMMGTGEASGENRAIQAAEKAIANPLLDEISLQGARGVLINVIGSHDLTLFELDEAANRIREEVDPETNIIVGSTLDPDLDGVMRVSVVATGIDAGEGRGTIPLPRRSMAEPLELQTAIPQTQPLQETVATPAYSAPVEPEQQYFEEPRLQPEQAFQLEPEFRAEAPMQEPASNDGWYGEPRETATAAYQEPRDFAKEHEELAQSAKLGQPTPEALQRLQDAVSRVPKAEPVEEAKPEVASSNSRFAINNLINRMSGGGSRDQHRAQPPMHRDEAPHYEDISEEESERVEIPAFLRRQAN